MGPTDEAVSVLRYIWGLIYQYVSLDTWDLVQVTLEIISQWEAEIRRLLLDGHEVL